MTMSDDMKDKEMLQYRQNDRIQILPQWQDEGDEEIDFVCVEDEDGGRVRIEALIGLDFNPQQVVETHMIRHVASQK